MWTIFNVFIEFVTILLLFYVLVFWLRGMWDLSSPTRDRTLTPCIKRQSLNHWTTREVPVEILYSCIFRKGLYEHFYYLFSFFVFCFLIYGLPHSKRVLRKQTELCMDFQLLHSGNVEQASVNVVQLLSPLH